jgi:hypothetical protein
LSFQNAPRKEVALVKAKIIDYYFPSSCMANTEAGFGIWGHLEEADSPCIGFYYRDGPADFVMVNSYWRVKVARGTPATVVYESRYWPVCTDMHFPRGSCLVFPVEGSYTLDVFAGYMSGDTPVIEDGPYPVSIDVSPFSPASVSITGFNVPLKAYARIGVGCSVSGHVDVGGGNPCVGLMYVDGPSYFINIDGMVVEKGKANVYGYTSVKDACTNIDFRGSVSYPMAGTYRLGVVSGYIDVLGGAVNVTSRTDVNVDVEVAKANVSGRVFESYLFGLVKCPSNGATVSIGVKSTYTRYGEYSLTDIPLGNYMVTVSKRLFEGKTQMINLSEPEKTYTLDFEIPFSRLISGIVLAAVPLATATAFFLKRRMSL